MPPVGRPRSLTNSGVRAPVNELGVPDLGLGGFTSGNPLTGVNSPWRMYTDELEYVPELMWPWSVRTFDHMRTDSQLAGLLTATMWGITQLRYVVDPNGARPSAVKEISEDLNIPVLGDDDKPRGRMKRRFSHANHVRKAVMAIVYGHEHFEQNCDIVDGKARLRKLAPRPPHTIQAINVADDGGLVSIQQWAGPNQFQRMGVGPEIPVDRLAVWIFEQEGMSQTGRPLIRDCYKDWLLKDRMQRVEAINHERAGGVPFAVGAMGMTDDEVMALSRMMQSWRIGENAGGAVPYGSDIKIAKGTGSDIDATIKRYDESMARRFLLALINLAQGGQNVGSYALSENFEDFFLVGQRVIAQWYCDVMTEHVIEDLIDWNYGEDEELAPRVTWERSTEDSLGVEALATLVENEIITVDEELENSIRYRYLLPRLTGKRPPSANELKEMELEQNAKQFDETQKRELEQAQTQDGGGAAGQGAPSTSAASTAVEPSWIGKLREGLSGLLGSDKAKQ